MFCVHFHQISLSSLWNKNGSEQICTEYKNKHFILNNFCLKKQCLFWYNTETYCTEEEAMLTIWRILILCRKPNATDKHSEHVIIIAFLLQH